MLLSFMTSPYQTLCMVEGKLGNLLKRLYNQLVHKEPLVRTTSSKGNWMKWNDWSHKEPMLITRMNVYNIRFAWCFDSQWGECENSQNYDENETQQPQLDWLTTVKMFKRHLSVSTNPINNCMRLYNCLMASLILPLSESYCILPYKHASRARP